MDVYKNVSIEQLKMLSREEIAALAKELRETIIDVSSSCGGHLASNLGVVELTIALHRVFNSPQDKFLFDVGHQCYAHKLLTGRADSFQNLRQKGGASGFPNPTESEHDPLYEGHCGTSLSAALGFAEANRLQGKDDFVVAIVGDGALTNGMIYEALNNCAGKALNLIIVINDNEMSISRNVGGLHRYLSRIRNSKSYFSFKRGMEVFLRKLPLIGKGLAKFLKAVKNRIRKSFLKDNLFEDMGLAYLGPIDGHNVEKLTVVLEEAKTKNRPCVVHVCTKKGQGYSHAEEHPENYHSVGVFDVEQGADSTQKECFSSKAGEYVCERAKEDASICTITAAMCDGTGLTEFAKEFPERFFDVGIAEEHAVTFAAGLSASGLKPILFLYSTFAQRSFDQIFHDVCIQQLPLVLALDRSGIVAGDGITHQGIFDYSMFTALPNIEIYSPESYQEMRCAFDRALQAKGLAIVRYPRGAQEIDYHQEAAFVEAESGDYAYTGGVENAEIVLVSYGRICREAYRAMKLLQAEGRSVGLLKLKKIYPIDFTALEGLTAGARTIHVVEEGILGGGVGEKISAHFGGLGCPADGVVGAKKVSVSAIEHYVEHGGLKDLIEACGLSGEKIADVIRNA